MSRRNQSKGKNKLFITVFFILLLFLSYKVIGKRNKILDLNNKKISYVEIIKFENNTMKTINDKAKVKKIIGSLNRISAEEVQKDTLESDSLDFINIYDKTFKRKEIARDGCFIRIDTKWYKMSKNGSDIFDSILKEYS
ncbi:hypothetical protein [Peptoniphilus stercorisuis]|uniref:Uncharacterized protein n=1 Tax=Peptoniphilus stercorisuis TaxID=1436965 RepID=A0ABS4KCP4_9FIRM|nr:hypothetical protein [Peptoniphilus stercorisuis]MBP2025535.1 hypothetical protein [Peptoniphilus stercorisuis]